MLSHTNDIYFAPFRLHEFNNITQITKVVLQYMDVHRLPVTHFTSIMAASGMTDKTLPNIPYTLTGEGVLSNSQIYPIHPNPGGPSFPHVFLPVT